MCLRMVGTGRISPSPGHFGYRKQLIPCVAAGRTPLMGATRYADVDVVRYLVEQGADVRAVDSRGRTALSIATEERKFEVVEIPTRMSSDQEK